MKLKNQTRENISNDEQEKHQKAKEKMYIEKKFTKKLIPIILKSEISFSRYDQRNAY